MLYAYSCSHSHEITRCTAVIWSKKIIWWINIGCFSVIVNCKQNRGMSRELMDWQTRQLRHCRRTCRTSVSRWRSTRARRRRRGGGAAAGRSGRGLRSTTAGGGGRRDCRRPGSAPRRRGGQSTVDQPRRADPHREATAAATRDRCSTSALAEVTVGSPVSAATK